MSDKARIMVIEDDEGNRRSLVRALTREGYRVDAFGEADSALSHLQRHRDISLIVTDLMLPGTDGFGVLEGARRINPTVGLLMITGHGTVESAVEAMKRGADDYLTKPVNLDELRKRLTRAALALRSLEGLLGPERLTRALRTYGEGLRYHHPTAEDLQAAIPDLDHAFKEVLRLSPPVPMMMRRFTSGPKPSERLFLYISSSVSLSLSRKPYLTPS